MELIINSATVLRFKETMDLLIKTFYTAYGRNKATICAAYPKVNKEKENLSVPLITYYVDLQMPAEFMSTREIKSRIRESIEAEDDQGNTCLLEVWAQTFEYRVMFEIWAEDGKIADETQSLFFNFMHQYIGYFKKMGVSEILFKEANGRQSKDQWDESLIRRQMIYSMRIEEKFFKQQQIIDRVVMESENIPHLFNTPEPIVTVVDNKSKTL